MLNFSNAFSASIEMIVWFCLFFCWCGVSHWFICVCWTILVTLGWILLGHGVWSFLCAVVFSLLIFCWESLHLYSSKILACNFLFWWCLCLVLASGWCWLHRCPWKCSLLFKFLEEFEMDQCKFFVCLVEFTCEAILTFVCREFLNYRFYFSSSDLSVQIIYFFLIQFWRTVCF